MKHLPDLLVLLGLAAITIGLWQVYAPLGWAFGGVAVATCGVEMVRKKPRDKEPRDWREPR